MFRNRPDATAKQLAQAASLLKAAAGLQVYNPDSEPQANSLLKDGEYVDLIPGVKVAEETHTNALWLLSDLYILGDGFLLWASQCSLCICPWFAIYAYPVIQKRKRSTAMW